MTATRHKWIGPTDQENFSIEWNVLCMFNQAEPSTHGDRQIEVTTKNENVNCRDCLRLLPIDLLVKIDGGNNGVAVHTEDQQMGGLWMKIKDGSEVATIFLTNDQAEMVADNLYLRARRSGNAVVKY